jgi:hypothetical protein
MPDLFSDFEGDAKARRDEGMGRVTANAGPWVPAARTEIAKLRGWCGTGEDLRLLLVPLIGPPHHHNAWGPLIKYAIERHWLFPTGERRHMKSKKSNARSTAVYRSR